MSDYIYCWLDKNRMCGGQPTCCAYSSQEDSCGVLNRLSNLKDSLSDITATLEDIQTVLRPETYRHE